MPENKTLTVDFALQLEDRHFQNLVEQIDPNDQQALKNAALEHAESKQQIMEMYCD